LRKRRANYIDTYIEINTLKIPLRIHIEVRSTIRISLGKDNVLLRIPIYAAVNLEEHLNTAKTWLTEISDENPDVLKKYDYGVFKHKVEIFILGRDKYEILLNDSLVKNLGEIKISGHTVNIWLPTKIDEFEKKIMARNLLSKIFARKYKKFVEERIKYWNELHFKKEIKSVTLRYNSSNWGSCSTTTKINISTRALLLPLEIFDYVIIHELSHLVEMNHSQKFWKVVEKVMPDYKKAENYLKEKTSDLDF
jgi:hypothetical protein